MACCLFGAKPLSEPMLPYCQLDPKKHISVKNLKFKFPFKEMHLKMLSAKVVAILPGLHVLNHNKRSEVQSTFVTLGIYSGYLKENGNNNVDDYKSKPALIWITQQVSNHYLEC